MDSDKKSGSGGVMVEEGLQSGRKRFYIELKPGETTIVSWAKMLKDASPPPSPEPGYDQDEESRGECSNVAPKKENKEPNDGSSTTEHCQPKKQGTAILEILDKNDIQATKNTKMGHARMKGASKDTNYDDKWPLLSVSVTSSMANPSDISIKSGPPYGVISDQAAICAESQSITLMSHNTKDHYPSIGRLELPDLNIPYAVQAANNSPTCIKNESGGMVTLSMLENTILDLETMVAESRPLHRDVQEAERLVTTKSRLPRELKQKLEIVARLAHLSQGRISDELIMRLMSILGHWLKLRTLKRYLREMVPDDLLAGKREDVSFCRIKEEVIEMIRLRIPSLEVKDGQCNGSLELPAAQKAKYSMDHEMEDKICDFYDVYVQGMDEVKSSQIRRFYILLAELWPKGTMDNHGIRNAICRAKERRRMLSQEMGHEKGKRKTPSTARLGEKLGGEVNVVGHTQTAADTNAPVSTFSDSVIPGTPELDQNLSAPAKRCSPPSSGSCRNVLKQGEFDNGT